MTQTNNSTTLIVEDETIVRLIGSDNLTDVGYDMVEAATADEALRILDQHGDVEVLVTDIRGPGSMDGLELARFVHALAYDKNTDHAGEAPSRRAARSQTTDIS